MSTPNPAVAIPNIMKSQDKEWLQGFRANVATGGAKDILNAIDQRLAELGVAKLRRTIGKPLVHSSLAQRIHEAVRVYEECLAHQQDGRRVGASRNRSMIKKWGEKEAVQRTVVNMKMSNGLELLAEHGRLDCAYEQIVIDFPDEFEPDVISKARENLDRLPKAAAQ